MPLRYAAERILIRCPNWLGDAIAATAAVRCMRKNYPEAHITLLLSAYVRPAVAHAPWFDEVVEFDRDQGMFGETLRITRMLRQRPRADLALLLTHSFSSALVVRIGGARRRVGHARGGRSWLLTDPAPWPCASCDVERVSKVDLYSSLLEYLGCEGAQDQRPELFTSPEDERRCDQLLKQHGRDAGRPLLAIVPGAAYGASKLWAPERFATVADTLAARRNMQAVILVGPGEYAIGQAILRNMKRDAVLFPERGISFDVLKAVVRRSALMVCNDTGPRHAAIAYNVPVVVLMGPTDPNVTHSDYERTAIIRQDVPCGPCYLRACPTDHRCMRLITPERVVAASEDLLDRYGESAAPRIEN